MNAAQIHLALNHAPLFLSLTGGVILLWGMIRKNESYKILSFYIMIAASLFTLPVFFTGEGAEEMVENLPGVSEVIIENHEAMAKIALVIICITGVVALGGLVLRKNTRLKKIVFTGALLLSLVSFGTMAQTAHLGGLIRHGELRNGPADTTEGPESDQNNDDD